MNNSTLAAESVQLVATDPSTSSLPWMSILVAFAVVYPMLCSYLRFQRRDEMANKLGYKTREDMARMTNDDAQKISTYLGELEFPKVYETGLQFGLFKTYAIPTISKLLAATTQLSSPENADKRYADTVAIIGEFMSNPPQSERALKSIARLNFIHGKYQKAGKISNDDMLYTLSVFIIEPVGWISRFEWRGLTDMEICGVSTFWKSIGDAMNISYAPLRRQEWKDGLDFYDDIKEWADGYEESCMVPHKLNRKVADETAAILLYYVPKSLQPAGLSVITALLPERLRVAMLYDKPSETYYSLINVIFGLRKFFLRYLSLPRPSFMAVRQVSQAPDAVTGNYHLLKYTAHPFYLKPGFLNRYGLEAWMVRFMGGDVPGDKGSDYIPQGYNLDTVGPESMVGKGGKEIAMHLENLQVERPAGCPFAFAR